MPYKNKADRNRRERNRKRKHKKQGLCTNCNRQATHGILCKTCREGHRRASFKANRLHREKLNEQGRCVKCGNQRDEPKLRTCMNCRMHANEGRPYN